MKPPPRTRKKPRHHSQPEARKGRWRWRDLRNLLKALKTHSDTNQGLQDIDYTFLRKYVPGRSISEIQAAVNYLKDEVISLASFKLTKKRLEEEKVRKPIEAWTVMASSIAGTQEEAISNAFSQMLIVSSTEPRTLRNCDPPRVYRPPADKDGPVGRTVPFRPMPRFPVKIDLPVRPRMMFKTPAPSMGPARRLPVPSQVVRVPNSKIPPQQQQFSTTVRTTLAATSTSTSQSAATSCQPAAAEVDSTTSASTRTVTPAAAKTERVGTTQKPSEKLPTPLSTTSTTNSTSHSPQTALSASATSQTPIPPSSGASSDRPTPPLSTTAKTCYTMFGRTSKYATEDSPRTLGVKSVVDFEKIYRFLSVIHRPQERCQLTPMESAIVLDLLMSLPEELPLLDCNKLHKHLIQMYKCLSSHPNSKMAGEVFKGLKDGPCAREKGKKPPPGEAESQSSGSNNTSSQSEDTMRLCPPLNPFMVPIELLRRK